METIQQNCNTSARAALLVLACLVLAPSVVTANVDSRTANDSAMRRVTLVPAAHTMERSAVNPRAFVVAQSGVEQKMIDDCRKNFGTDCEARAKEATMPLPERRQKMIARCRSNFGTDCEKSVDIELAAEQNPQKFIRPKPAQ